MKKYISYYMIKLIHQVWWLLPDKLYLQTLYFFEMGKVLHLSHPVLYQEKLQWLKLYNRKPEYTKMVDKVTAKEYVAKIIGERYIIPTLGVWDSFDNINFDELPNQFVLKTNNGGSSEGVVVCKDKSNLDIQSIRRKLERSQKVNLFHIGREWPYKNIKPKFIAEKYLFDDSPYNRGGVSDYKFTCFNGVADNVMVCFERECGNTKFYFFDKYWNLLPLNVRGKNTPSDFKLPKPPCMDEMFKLAGILSEGIPFLRVDFYCVDGRPYFGETTFFPASGFDTNILPETEAYFGEKIILPPKSSNSI